MLAERNKWQLQAKEQVTQIRYEASNNRCGMHRSKEKWKKRASMYKDLLRRCGIPIPTDSVSASSVGPSVTRPQIQPSALVWNGHSYIKITCS